MNSITVKKAREILGDEADIMSDDEIQRLIDDLSLMAKWALDEVIRQRMINRGEPIV